MFGVTEEPAYGGFWRRAGALLIDGLITLPVLLLQLWLFTQSRLFPVYSAVIGFSLTFFYEVYLVQRYSGTPGKLLMGLRITDIRGGRVTWTQALLRTSPTLAIGIVASTVVLAAMLQLTDAQFQTLSVAERSKVVASFAPGWYLFNRWAGQLWDLSELLVLLTNEKRRALHDFLAGTVVIAPGR